MKEFYNRIMHREAQLGTTSSKLNWLRAAVLGANDGIVSVSSVIVGVAGASNSKLFILTAGVAALVAGALSMAAGEYVSVSTQRDTEKALLEKERQELIDFPERELEELAQIYKAKGLTTETAHKVAQELTDNDAFAAHVDAELGIDPDDLTNPMHAAFASGLSFVCGGIIPVIAVIFVPALYRIPAVFASVVLALMITGGLSAHAGGASKRKATIRVVLGGLIAMAITFAVGKIFGVAGI
jgi:VIT1/CCC1 family predicted Fe2+/Mn2+ transporter